MALLLCSSDAEALMKFLLPLHGVGMCQQAGDIHIPHPHPVGTRAIIPTMILQEGTVMPRKVLRTAGAGINTLCVSLAGSSAENTQTPSWKS